MMKYILFRSKPMALILLFCILCSCQAAEKDVEVPEQIQELTNLTVYSEDEQPAVNLSFQREAVYGDSEEVTFGRMGDMVVDSLGRVFISDVRNMVIYIFEPDGRFKGQFGRRGRGPSEFSSYIKNLQIHRNRLYAFDPGPSRLTIFNLESLVSESTLILAENRGRYEELARAFPWIRNVYVRSDSTYIVEFTVNASSSADIQLYQNLEVKGLFYLLDNSGSISREVLEFTSEIRTNTGGFTNLNDFFGIVLRGFLNDDRFLITETDHFLVKTFSPNGDYQRAFFYPLKKLPLTHESAIEAGVRDLNLNRMHLLDLPETWPVLTDMIIDDQNRLWIATTVEDFSVYEWWVLEETGELITRFKWPRNEPLKIVTNGYMYTLETEEETGLQQIVRYRIQMEER